MSKAVYTPFTKDIDKMNRIELIECIGIRTDDLCKTIHNMNNLITDHLKLQDDHLELQNKHLQFLKAETKRGNSL